MAAMKQIPKACSAPADPSDPSFLTTLPPEIRNAVYEVLFKRNKPVLVHNVDAYYARESLKIESTSHWLFEEEIEEGLDEMYDHDVDGNAEFRHNFHLALPLLDSCRQIYYESAGVFYGANTFVVSRALHRHDIQDHEHSPYCQIIFAPKWLSQLGSQYSLLRKVVIDIDAICPHPCFQHDHSYNILPLVQFLWIMQKTSAL